MLVHLVISNLYNIYYMVACVAWRFWLGALNNKGGRGQRNREEIGARATYSSRGFAGRCPCFCSFAAQSCSRQNRHATKANYMAEPRGMGGGGGKTKWILRSDWLPKRETQDFLRWSSSGLVVSFKLTSTFMKWSIQTQTSRHLHAWWIRGNHWLRIRIRTRVEKSYVSRPRFP